VQEGEHCAMEMLLQPDRSVFWQMVVCENNHAVSADCRVLRKCVQAPAIAHVNQRWMLSTDEATSAALPFGHIPAWTDEQVVAFFNHLKHPEGRFV